MCYRRVELGLTRNDQMKLATIIGKLGLASLDDRVCSDACWLFSYVLCDADDAMIALVCEGSTVQMIVQRLSSEDINV